LAASLWSYLAASFWSIAFVVGAACIAALITCVDSATKIKEPIFAIRTWEWILLWLINAAVACAVLGAALSKNWLIPSWMGFAAAVFGYPLLLQSKLFTIRGDEPEGDRSAGPQLLLEVADILLSPGIRDSVDEKRATILSEWHERNLDTIGAKARDYLASRDWPPSHPKTKDEALRWLEELLEDVRCNPANKAKNAEALFLEVNRVGGLRGTRWILRQIARQ
jgi:hypothetical protein